MAAVRRHPLIAFFVLAYAISWSTTPLYVARVPPFFPDFPFLGAGPLVAGLVVTWLAMGRAGLKDLGARMIRWRVGWQWYAVALAIPLAVAVVTVVFCLALGAPANALAQLPPVDVLLFVFALRLVNPMDGPMGEEPGWRGVALPRLQASRSPLAAAVILAILVALWHWPDVVVTQRLPPLGLLGAFAVTFWYCWIFNRAGGSVLMSLVMHAAEGTFGLAVGSIFVGADLALAISIYVAATCVVSFGLVVIDREAWRPSGAASPNRAESLAP